MHCEFRTFSTSRDHHGPIVEEPKRVPFLPCVCNYSHRNPGNDRADIYSIEWLLARFLVPGVSKGGRHLFFWGSLQEDLRQLYLTPGLLINLKLIKVRKKNQNLTFSASELKFHCRSARMSSTTRDAAPVFEKIVSHSVKNKFSKDNLFSCNMRSTCLVFR